MHTLYQKFTVYKLEWISEENGDRLYNQHTTRLIGCSKDKWDKKYMMAVMKGILFCALQGITLRGHNEGSHACNQGNFKSLMTLFSCHLEVVKNQLQDGS